MERLDKISEPQTRDKHENRKFNTNIFGKYS